MLVRTATLATLAGVALAWAVSAQSARGLLVGQAVDGTTGRPLSGVVLTLSGGPALQPPGPPLQTRVMADDTGGFVFSDLPVGTYTLIANRGGYTEGEYGRMRPSGAPVNLELAAGARLGDITIRLWRLGAITGMVSDEANDPLVGVQVRALARMSMAGRRRFVRASEATSSSSGAGYATTDDRGVYRIGALLPGEYVVVVPARQTTVPSDLATAAFDALLSDPLKGTLLSQGISPSKPGSPGARQVGEFVLQSSGQALGSPPAASGNVGLAVYPTTYSGDASTARQATTITIGSGETRAGADFHLRATPAVRVSGVLTGPQGPISLLAVRLVPVSVTEELGGESGFESATTITGGTGAFTMLGVTPGQYVLRAVKQPSSPPTGAGRLPGDPLLWLAESVTVANQDVRVNATMREGLTVRGRFGFDGAPPPLAQQRVPILLEPADGRSIPGVSTRPGQVDDAGGFVTPPIPGGRYLLRLGSTPTGWALRAAMLDGRDVSDTPFDLSGNITDVIIEFTSKITTLSGTTRTTQGAPDADAAVLVFPTDASFWQDFGLNVNLRRLRITRPSPTGAYAFNAMPPGDYFVIAIPDAQADDWRDRDRLTALSRVAARVHLGEGDTLTQDLRTAVIK